MPAEEAKASELRLSNHQPKGAHCEGPEAFLHRVIFGPPCNSWLRDFMVFRFIPCFDCMRNAHGHRKSNIRVLEQTGKVKLPRTCFLQAKVERAVSSPPVSISDGNSISLHTICLDRLHHVPWAPGCHVKNQGSPGQDHADVSFRGFRPFRLNDTSFRNCSARVQEKESINQPAQIT